MDKILGGEGNDKLSGNEGRDSIKGGYGNDDVWGGDGADYILGQGGADKLRGDDGNDFIFGGNGKDELWGQNGNDSVRGDAGDDLIGGGNGRDFMVGGAGKDRLVDWEDWDAADIFAFFTGDSGMTEATRDVIEGFDSGIDRIDLRGYGDLTWQSAATFSGGGSAEVRFDGDYVLIDADGNGSAEESIELKWVDIVFSSDFIL
jgi:Ca2+-binding RTX toxin-like protein